MTEPIDREISHRTRTQADLLLVQFLALKDDPMLPVYRGDWRRAVSATGGRQIHCVWIDQVLAGGPMPYQVITIDAFPDFATLQSTFDAVKARRESTIVDLYGLLVEPNVRLPQMVRALGFLAPLLSRLLGTRAEREMLDFASATDPKTGPVPETLAELREHDQETPFYMMNLNRYFSRAHYANGEAVSGTEAYGRYGSRIAPYLISIRAYPAVIGRVLGTFVGNERSPLHDEWHEFALISYRSRQKFINMMSNTPAKALHHRTAGLQRAILMPASDI